MFSFCQDQGLSLIHICLTELGREAVRRMQRLNILPDVSHTSDRIFWDIMDLAEGPVSASHSNCRALCDVRRNLTDEQLRAIDVYKRQRLHSAKKRRKQVRGLCGQLY